MLYNNFNRQIMSAKIHNQKGKSPDFKLRFLNYNLWLKLKIYKDNQEVGLEAAIL